MGVLIDQKEESTSINEHLGMVIQSVQLDRATGSATLILVIRYSEILRWSYVSHKFSHCWSGLVWERDQEPIIMRHPWHENRNLSASKRLVKTHDLGFLGKTPSYSVSHAVSLLKPMGLPRQGAFYVSPPLIESKTPPSTRFVLSSRLLPFIFPRKPGPILICPRDYFFFKKKVVH